MVDIPQLVKRADRYARKTGRSPGGISKALFDDVRTLDLLRGGFRDIQVSRIERAAERLADLEAEQIAS